MDRVCAMKRLILIPIIHTAADLGSLADSVKAHYLSRLGPAAWAQRERAVEEIWSTVRVKIAALRLDYRKVLVYEDGLPVCGHELQIVQELAQAGSLNHQLILDLLAQGAVLMGTEDPQLLLREYQLQRRRLRPDEAAPDVPAPADDEAAELLAARDRFIAQRITETLPDGATGLLFLGAAHRLEALQAPDLHAEPLG
jgi:hypothetical protein